MPARHAPPDRSHTGEKPKAAKLVLTLDGIRINELTTADIRSWQRLIVQEVGQYSVKKPPLGWSMYQLVASNKAAPPMKAMGMRHRIAPSHCSLPDDLRSAKSSDSTCDAEIARGTPL